MQFNEVFFFIIGFFSFVYGKKIEFGRPKGARQLFRAEGEARSPTERGLGEAQRRAHEPKASTTTEKRKHKFRV